jgi:hypothetical protein
MFTKIYLGLLAVACVISGFFTFYSYSWLQSIGSPEIAAENFEYFSRIGWPVLWLTFIILVLWSNFLIWKRGISWPIWVSYAYFAVFMIMQTLWLAPSLTAFKESNGLAQDGFSFTPFIGVMTILVLGIAVFCDRFIVLRLRESYSGRYSESVATPLEEEN